MRNQIFQQPQPKPQPLSWMQLAQAYRSFQGNPQQAKEQFCQTVAQLGWTPQQLNAFLDEVESKGKMLGLF